MFLREPTESATNLTQLVVTFNKAVDEDTATLAANYQLDGGALPASSVLTLSEDGKTVTITVDNTEAFTNATYVTVVASVGDTIKDAEGLTITQTAKAVYVNDTVKPVVTGSSYVKANDELTINFSEPLATEGTVVVKDSNGVTQTAPFSLDASGLFATVDTSGLTDDKTYTLTMVAATDLKGNYFANNTVSLSFKTGATELVKPTVSSVKSIASDKIEVTFSEKLSVAGTLNGNGLTLDSNLDTPYDYSVDATGLVYTIVVPTMTDNTVVAYEFASQVDLNNNTIDTVTKQISYFNDVTAPTLVSTSVKNRVVTLTFNETVVDASGTGTLRTPENVLHTVADLAINTVPANSKQITVDLAALVGSDAASGTYTLTLPNNVITDSEGNSKAYSATFSLSDLSSSDADKPEVTGVVYTQAANGGTVELSFDEVVSSSALNLNNYTVDGQKVFKDAYFNGNKQTVLLTLKENSFAFDANRVLEVANVSDLAGNVIVPYTETITFEDNTVATLLSAQLGADLQTITLTYNEAMTVSSIAEGVGVEELDFKVLVGGVEETFLATAEASVDARTFTITLADALNATEYAKTITLAPATTYDVADDKGNLSPTFTSFTVTK